MKGKVNSHEHGPDVYGGEDKAIRTHHPLDVRHGALQDSEGSHKRETTKCETECEFLRSHNDHWESNKEGQRKEECREKKEGAKCLIYVYMERIEIFTM
jgi:hypothetical protein